jgi:thiamine pyrophosphate-dependent acetolactate synthase large subunit-like protein
MARPNRVSNQPAAVLDRRTAVPALIERPQDFLVVAGLAGTAQEMSAITHDAASVYALGGAMGAAPSMALGLALAQPKRRVLCITGDGELLMNVGALATIAVMAPANLTVVCVDNGHYGETGNQDSHTGLGVRLDRIAEGAGFPVVHTINGESELAEGKRLLREGGQLAFVLLRVKEGPPLNIKRKRDAAFARSRFKAALAE